MSSVLDDSAYSELVLPLDSGLGVVLALASASHAGGYETVRPARAAGVVVHSQPAGRALVRLPARTPYGSARRLWVRAARGGWLKIAAEDGPGGVGWVRRRETRSAVTLRRRIEIDRSAGTLAVIGAGRRWSTRVVVGGTATPTPAGTFQVTDRLDGARYGGAYGDRVLVISAYGDRARTSRVAIHGVPPGARSKRFSAGCIRVPKRALLRLAREAPPGTPVRIRA
jgi:hypothetical protein